VIFEHLFGHTQHPAEQRTLQTLRVGDALSYLDEDFTVEQRHELHGDGGDAWWTYLIQSPERRLWLDVDEDQGLTLTMYEPSTVHVALPIGETISVVGKVFHADEHGFANDVVTKRSGESGERLEYWYLTSDEGDQLVIRRLGDNELSDNPALQTGTVEVGIGKEIKTYDVKIYQGEGGR
jgi:hypothetical protein